MKQREILFILFDSLEIPYNTALRFRDDVYPYIGNSYEGTVVVLGLYPYLHPDISVPRAWVIDTHKLLTVEEAIQLLGEEIKKRTI